MECQSLNRILAARAVILSLPWTFTALSFFERGFRCLKRVSLMVLWVATAFGVISLILGACT